MTHKTYISNQIKLTSASNCIKGYYSRFINNKHWNVPSELLNEAQELDQMNVEEDIYDVIDSDQINDAELKCRANIIIYGYIREIQIIIPNDIKLLILYFFCHKRKVPNIGDRVITVNGYSGTIRFIGGVHFDEHELIGIELATWSPDAHNGIVHGHKYFNPPNGRGYFITKNGVLENLGPIKNITRMKTTTYIEYTTDNLELQTLCIGDKVRLIRGKTGTVKYIGPVYFTQEEVVGIRLDKWHPNANNGTVRGVRYFYAPPGRGYFARKRIINAKGVKIPLKIKLGCRVKLNTGITGIVRYIGMIDDVEMIGIDLDIFNWKNRLTENDGNGYFKARYNYGYFGEKKSVIVVYHSNFNDKELERENRREKKAMHKIKYYWRRIKLLQQKQKMGAMLSAREINIIQQESYIKQLYENLIEQ
eukprot:547458_1